MEPEHVLVPRTTATSAYEGRLKMDVAGKRRMVRKALKKYKKRNNKQYVT